MNYCKITNFALTIMFTNVSLEVSSVFRILSLYFICNRIHDCRRRFQCYPTSTPKHICNQISLIQPTIERLLHEKLMPIFHCNPKPLTFVFHQCETFASLIPACWYQKTLTDPLRVPWYPTQVPVYPALPPKRAGGI